MYYLLYYQVLNVTNKNTKNNDHRIIQIQWFDNLILNLKYLSTLYYYKLNINQMVLTVTYLNFCMIYF